MTLPPIPLLELAARYVNVPEIIAAVLRAYDRFGYALVLVGAWMEHSILLGVVVPGGTLVSLGGAAARVGTLELPLTIGIGALGMVLGACTDYWIGRTGLARFLLSSRIGPRVQRGLDRAAAILKRHGWWTITLVHAMGAGRSAVAVTAGICRMRFSLFVLCEIPAAVVWSTLFNLLGYGVAMNLDLIRTGAQRGGIVLAAVAAAVLLMRWRWRRRSSPAGAA
jgi:membrane-associated protein